MAPLVSVILPVWNEEKNLRSCLEAVFSQSAGFEFEILVVDSGSTDRTRQIAREFAKDRPLRLLEVKPSEFGHGRTRQFASEQALGEYLVYLVADAVPADAQWLAKLVEAAQKDDRIAGAYSRQLPRPDAGLPEKARLKKRKVFSAAPAVAELKKAEDYWLMNPLERIAFCDFDDVSALRRRSVLQKIPIADAAWAEDLVWSRDCLLAGYKIMFAPESVVAHSHSASGAYWFRRGWVDQKAAGKYFGQLYYPGLAQAIGGFSFSLRSLLQDLRKEDAGFFQKLRAMLRAPGLCGTEILGRYLAGLKPETEAGLDLIALLSRAELFPKNARSRVAETSFALGDSHQKVILAQPLAIINYQVKVKENSELRFGIGIKPEAFKFRAEPIDFMVAIDQEPVFRQRLEMSLEQLRGWKEFSLSLEPWRGREVKLSLVTASTEEKHGWAAWASPRIVFQNKRPGLGWKNFLASRAERFARPERFRHP